ncbi:MAG: type II toxin-antitoxin system PemK/MazF family toxin [Edaphobacter sp.]
MRGEVYWVAFDPAIGGEIQKTRPAVIVSNDAANTVLNRVIVVPISSKTDRVYPGEALIQLNGESRKAMADQLTTASRLRLKGRIGNVSPEDMTRIDRATLLQLGIKT